MDEKERSTVVFLFKVVLFSKHQKKSCDKKILKNVLLRLQTMKIMFVEEESIIKAVYHKKIRRPKLMQLNVNIKPAQGCMKLINAQIT